MTRYWLQHRQQHYRSWKDISLKHYFVKNYVCSYYRRRQPVGNTFLPICLIEDPSLLKHCIVTQVVGITMAQLCMWHWKCLTKG